MKRRLFVLSDHKSDLLSALEKDLTLTPGTLVAPASRTSQLEREHAVFVDATELDEATILGHDSVKAALRSGVPLIILRPTSSLLRAISAFGVEGAAACILVRGQHGTTYCQTYMDATSTRLLSGVAWSSEKSEAAAGHGGKDGDHEPPARELLRDGSIEHKIMEPDLQALIPADLAKADQIEEALRQLDERGRNTELPTNRRQTGYFPMSWATMSLSDPSGETGNTQTSRFQFSVTFQLISADLPAKRKVFGVKIGGPGFEPFSGSMIRDDTNHRGWAQSVTMITMAPSNASFGNVEDYVPVNAANETSITAGFSWELGASGGSGGGSVSASFSKDNSHTISSKDFKTLTTTYGTRGMRFFQNTYIVGGDTIVDPRYFGFDNLVSQSGWTSEMGKMFYDHISGKRVRSWPDLSRQLVKPDSECVWYASSTETGTGTMLVTGGQGMNYFYKTTNWIGVVSQYCAHAWLERNTQFSVNFGSVTYPP